MIRAVIFDLDGLLVDSEPYWEAARRDYCLQSGCTWTSEDELSVKGHNSLEWADRIIQRCHMTSGRSEIISGVSDEMRRAYASHVPLLPGATEAVELLAMHFPLGLASSSPENLIEFVLEKSQLRPYFSVLLSADEAGKGKPHPDVFLIAADRLGHSPSETVVLEDSTAGILAARAAGMSVVAVPNEHFPPSEAALGQADIILTSLLDLTIDRLKELPRETGTDHS